MGHLSDIETYSDYMQHKRNFCTGSCWLITDKFDMCSGKRSVVNGGKLNDKYQLTVSKNLDENIITRISEIN